MKQNAGRRINPDDTHRALVLVTDCPFRKQRGSVARSSSVSACCRFLRASPIFPRKPAKDNCPRNSKLLAFQRKATYLESGRRSGLLQFIAIGFESKQVPVRVRYRRRAIQIKGYLNWNLIGYPSSPKRNEGTRAFDEFIYRTGARVADAVTRKQLRRAPLILAFVRTKTKHARKLPV